MFALSAFPDVAVWYSARGQMPPSSDFAVISTWDKSESDGLVHESEAFPTPAFVVTFVTSAGGVLSSGFTGYLQLKSSASTANPRTSIFLLVLPIAFFILKLLHKINYLKRAGALSDLRNDRSRIKPRSFYYKK